MATCPDLARPDRLVSATNGAMGRRAGLVVLGVFLALVLFTSLALGSNHVGCSDIMRRIICEPGAILIVQPV